MGLITGPRSRWASIMVLGFSLFIKLRLISVLEDTTTNEKKRCAAAVSFLSYSMRPTTNGRQFRL